MGMGRKKKFNHQDVLTAIGETFITYGYEGTSLDDLVKATGLLRGSLYSTFGSKRRMFVAVLKQNIEVKANFNTTLNLIIIALMELTAHDLEINQLVSEWLTTQTSTNLPTLIGEAVLTKGCVPHGK